MAQIIEDQVKVDKIFDDDLKTEIINEKELSLDIYNKYQINPDEEVSADLIHFRTRIDSDLSGSAIKNKQVSEYGGHLMFLERSKKRSEGYDHDGQNMSEKWGLYKRGFDAQK